MLTPGNKFPEADYFDFQDKLIHFICFGLLSFIWAGIKIDWLESKKLKSVNYKFIVFALTFGVVLECAQLFIPFRSFDLFDLIVNEIGGITGFLTYLNISKKKSSWNNDQ